MSPSFGMGTRVNSRRVRVDRHWDENTDFGRSALICNMLKSMKPNDYFGWTVENTDESNRTGADMAAFIDRIESRIATGDIENKIFAGSWLNFMRDVDYDPILTLGVPEVPAAGDKWEPFTPVARDITELADRKALIRNHIWNTLVNFTTPHWVDILTTLDTPNGTGRDGQAALKILHTYFTEDNVENINSVAERCRAASRQIKFFEDPTEKFRLLLSDYNIIQKSQHSKEFPISWFVRTVLKTISSNPCYDIYRESGGDTAVLEATNTHLCVNLVKNTWNKRHESWEKNPMFKKVSNTTRKGGPKGPKKKYNAQSFYTSKGGGKPKGGGKKGGGKPKGGGKGGGKGKGVTCWTCGLPGHYSSNCMKEGGAQEHKCTNCGIYGHKAETCFKSHVSNKRERGDDATGAAKKGKNGDQNPTSGADENDVG